MWLSCNFPVSNYSTYKDLYNKIWYLYFNYYNEPIWLNVGSRLTETLRWNRIYYRKISRRSLNNGVKTARAELSRILYYLRIGN